MVETLFKFIFWGVWKQKINRRHDIMGVPHCSPHVSFRTWMHRCLSLSSDAPSIPPDTTTKETTFQWTKFSTSQILALQLQINNNISKYSPNQTQSFNAISSLGSGINLYVPLHELVSALSLTYVHLIGFFPQTTFHQVLERCDYIVTFQPDSEFVRYHISWGISNLRSWVKSAKLGYCRTQTSDICLEVRFIAREFGLWKDILSSSMRYEKGIVRLGFWWIWNKQ